MKALVALARGTARDKSLQPGERDGRLKRLVADFGAWQERFAAWSEKDESGLGMQKPDAPADEKK